jgi:gamma-glutamyltranspeptidase/glutathione hydrolase
MRDFEKPGRSLAAARNGMAATSHPASTLTAIEILKAGGTAMDAAVAACAVQCVVEAGSTGIGGDCFAMVSSGGSTDIRAYNGSGRTPAGLTLDRLLGEGVTEIGRTSPHSVTIPGAVDAWCRLVADFGRLPMRELLQPAIALARQGYPLTPRVVADITNQAALLSASPAARDVFLTDGQVPAIGDVQRQPRLADTLEAIGREGRDVFYRGEIAREMTETLAALGGAHALEDFAAAGGEYVTPISTRYRDRVVYEIPPNGQGIVALLILNILSRFAAPKSASDPAWLALIVEATRIAYAARDAHVGDPHQAEHLLSPAYADRLAALIDPEKATPQPVLAAEVEHSDTVYICVVDKDRNAVSFINSIFASYGSGIMAPRSSVLFHNRGQSFSLEPGHPNAVGPRKRPMHTIIPGMVAEGGRVTMPFGVMGGHYQAMGHAHFLSRVFDHGLDLQAAMDMPRLFPLPGTATVEAEEAVRATAGPELERRGYRVQPPRWAIGGSQAIHIDWDRGVLFGGSDHRKDGIALGY